MTGESGMVEEGSEGNLGESWVCTSNGGQVPREQGWAGADLSS